MAVSNYKANEKEAQRNRKQLLKIIKEKQNMICADCPAKRAPPNMGAAKYPNTHNLSLSLPLVVFLIGRSVGGGDREADIFPFFILFRAQSR